MRLVSTLLALSVAASATMLSGDARADNYTQFFKIAVLESTNNGGFIIHVAGNVPNNPTNNPAGCDTGVPAPNMWKYAYYTAHSYNTAEHREMMRQLLMSAFLSGRQVSLYVDSSSATCDDAGEPAAQYNFVRVWE